MPGESENVGRIEDPALDIAKDDSLKRESGSEQGRTDDFRTQAGEVIDNALSELEGTQEELQLRELKEWRDGEFKNDMRMIVESQQEICGQEGNEDACGIGRSIFQEMFGEPFDKEVEEAPAN